jgi:hypothetical protein
VKLNICRSYLQFKICVHIPVIVIKSCRIVRFKITFFYLYLAWTTYIIHCFVCSYFMYYLCNISVSCEVSSLPQWIVSNSVVCVLILFSVRFLLWCYMHGVKYWIGGTPDFCFCSTWRHLHYTKCDACKMYCTVFRQCRWSYSLLIS